MNKLFGGLRRPPINNNAHNNQPKAGGRGGEEEGEEARPAEWGGVYIHRFGGERVGSVINNKIKLSSSQINFFLGPIISLSIILSLRPWTNPSEEVPRGGVAGIAKAMPLDRRTASPW
jgi:hypothetical protein